MYLLPARCICRKTYEYGTETGIWRKVLESAYRSDLRQDQSELVRIPIKRLIARLGIDALDVPAPLMRGNES